MSRETKPPKKTEATEKAEVPKPAKKTKKAKVKKAGPYPLKASKAKVLPAGRWKRIKLDGKAAIVATCPFGHLGYLDDHQIAMDGTVSPSVDCPVDGCTFHQYVVLEGYGK